MSEQANGNGAKPRRILRPLSKEQWQLARLHYETGDERVNYAFIAATFKTSLSSVQKRGTAEKWKKGQEIVVKARRELQSATDRHLAASADKAGAIVAKALMDDLQPFIEKEKRAQIQRAVQRSKRGQRRLTKISGGYEVYDAKLGTIRKIACEPKDEMHLATAEDKYDNIIRRNLGMSDGATQTSVFNLGILTNHAAVQFVGLTSRGNETKRGDSQ